MSRSTGRSREADANASSVATDELTGAPVLTLRRLLDDLGAGVLEVVVAPGGLDVPIGDPVIHDPTLAPNVHRHDLVLGVGVTDDACRDLLRLAADASATAVVLSRTIDQVGALVGPEPPDVAVLATPPGLSWSHLHALVRTAIASEGRVPTLPEPGGVPLGDLFALANAVASMVGGATTIEDPQARVLAYSTTDDDELDEPRRQTILGRRVPEQWIRRLQEAGVFRQVYGGTDVVEVPDLSGDGTLRPRLAVSVRAGSEVLGSIWVAEGTQPFTSDAKAALRQASGIAALHMLRHRSGEDLDRRRRGERLRSILEGEGPVRANAASLGIEVDVPCAVVAFETLARDDAELIHQQGRVTDLVTLYCEAFRRQAVSVQIQHRIYTLLPVPDEAGEASLRRLAEDVVARADKALRARVIAGIGSIVDRLAGVPGSRGDAERVLRVLEERPDLGFVATVEDVWAQLAIMEWRELGESTPRLRRGKVAQLLEHDRRRGTLYVPTLRAWLEASGHVPTAAEAMHVHPNTFRHRFRRLSEIVGLDLEDPDQRLASAMQLLLIGPS